MDYLNASLARILVRTTALSDSTVSVLVSTIVAEVFLSRKEPILDIAHIDVNLVPFDGGLHRAEMERMVTGIIDGAIAIN